ncbi:MAG: type I-C CRISPR-associated protein Cas5c [Novosphingobium sp.]|nr:type I-C CRISPR-associated protein Cas5c [Novosphingobium sp.]
MNTNYGIKLKVWGDYACFTRPEMKVERVSYDVMTPSAARGILEAIYWKPAIRWVIDGITVLNPIIFTNIRRNEVGRKISKPPAKLVKNGGIDDLGIFIEDNRQQRAAMVLKNVSYIIDSHFEFTSNEDNNAGKHLGIFNRRARAGQCFNQPYMGCREFSANFRLVEPDEDIFESHIKGEKDLGFMLHDIDFENDMQACFFRAKMIDGIIEIPKFSGKESIL